MTTQEFASILPCYFGQKICTNRGHITNIRSIDNSKNGLLVWTEFIEECQDFAYACSIGEFKLILRKMEDMTDEENEKANSFPEGSPRVWYFNYLRSIGIDCDGILKSEFGIHQKEVKI